MGQNGTRKFGDRYYILAGRGSKENCQREAVEIRKAWKYVRIVPWNPFFDKKTRDLLDDYAIFVLEQRGRGTSEGGLFR